MVATARGDAAAGNTVPERLRVALDAKAAPQHIVLGLAHAVDAAGNDQISHAGLHPHGGVDHRLQAGAAAAINLQAGHAHAQLGVEGGNAADGRRLAVGVALAEDNVVNITALDAGATHQLADHCLGQAGGRDVLEHAAVAAHGRAKGFADDGMPEDGLVHGE